MGVATIRDTATNKDIMETNLNNLGVAIIRDPATIRALTVHYLWLSCRAASDVCDRPDAPAVYPHCAGVGSASACGPGPHTVCLQQVRRGRGE